MHYTLMALTTAATVPVSQMLLRGYVISEISPVEAGWWEGMNRISHMYLMVITSSFSVYYLPRLSELKDSVEIKQGNSEGLQSDCSDVVGRFYFGLPVAYCHDPYSFHTGVLADGESVLLAIGWRFF